LRIARQFIAETPGDANGVAIVDDTAYVADGWSGLQVIDITTPSQPVIIGYAATPSYANGVAVIGDTAYVADRNAGLVTVPLNMITELSAVTVNSETEITVTLPSPPAAGHWTLRVFNDDEYGELPGIVTFAAISSLDSDGEITLKDAVLALKLMTGKPVTLAASLSVSDVNNDGRIGLAEAVCIVRLLAK
jgi:hypothetical protein